MQTLETLSSTVNIPDVERSNLFNQLLFRISEIEAELRHLNKCKLTSDNLRAKLAKAKRLSNLICFNNSAVTLTATDAEILVSILKI